MLGVYIVVLKCNDNKTMINNNENRKSTVDTFC